ncbi:Digeranylgeranylglyceryl phosphate synthase [uncultured archaeon]|nr:Digeranylgeranylglyceryl phosphate synthase [uncultured archaeon]
MNKVLAILRLTRIEHSIMLVIAVLAAEMLAGGPPGAMTLALSLITPIFVSMGSFALNDYYDIEVDRLNKKNKRPLVNGSLTLRQAKYTAAASFAIGVVASAPIGAYAFAIAFVFAALAAVYARTLKEVLIVGNTYVALSMVIPFIYGNYVVASALAPSIIPVCAMVFLSGMGREIHGTIRDYKGDVKVRNALTLPKAIGLGPAAWVALVLYLAAIAVSAYLFVSVPPFEGSLTYGAMVLVSDVLLLYVSFGHIVFKSDSFYDGARNLSLAAMALAILSILLVSLVRI